MEPNTKSASTPTEEIVTDLKILGDDAQELLQATASEVGASVESARQTLFESLGVFRDKLAAVSAATKDKVETARIATDVYVRDNPWNAVGVATGIGFLAGVGLAAALFSSKEE